MENENLQEIRMATKIIKKNDECLKLLLWRVGGQVQGLPGSPKS